MRLDELAKKDSKREQDSEKKRYEEAIGRMNAKMGSLRLAVEGGQGPSEDASNRFRSGSKAEGTAATGNTSQAYNSRVSADSSFSKAEASQHQRSQHERQPSSGLLASEYVSLRQKSLNHSNMPDAAENK